MKAIDAPTKFNIAFGSSASGGTIRTIPEASQIGIQAGAASLTTGFPPVTQLPLGAGGTPPFGQDFNGILFEATSWDRWLSAGGPLKWDSVFSVAISGYPKGALVQSAVTFGLFFLCTADDNTGNPDSDLTGWTVFTLGIVPQTGAYFQFSSTVLCTLMPKNGGLIWINGINYQIPAGLTISNSGLAVSTSYYAYVYSNAGVPTLEFSTTGYTLNANGIPQKAADPTRTCVGLVRTSSAGVFQAQGFGTISYFNRKSLVSFVTYGSVNTSSGTYVELLPNPSGRAPFVTWADEVVQVSVVSQGIGSNGGSLVPAVDNVVVSPVGVGGFPDTGTASAMLAVGSKYYSEGAHTGQIYGQSNSGLVSFIGVGAFFTVQG